MIANPIQESNTDGSEKFRFNENEEPFTLTICALAKDRRIRKAPTDAPTPIFNTLGITCTTFSLILNTLSKTKTTPAMNTMPIACCQVQMPCATRVKAMTALVPSCYLNFHLEVDYIFTQ